MDFQIRSYRKLWDATWCWELKQGPLLRAESALTTEPPLVPRAGSVKCVLLSGRTQSRKAAQCVIQITGHSGKGRTPEWKHLQLPTQRHTVGGTGRGLRVSEWRDYSAGRCEGGQGGPVLRSWQRCIPQSVSLSVKHGLSLVTAYDVLTSVPQFWHAQPMGNGWGMSGPWQVCTFCLVFLETYKTALKTKVYSSF